MHFPLIGRRPPRPVIPERIVTTKDGRTLRVRTNPHPVMRGAAVHNEARFWAGFIAAMQAPDRAGFERRMRATVRDFEQSEAAAQPDLRVVRNHTQRP